MILILSALAAYIFVAVLPSQNRVQPIKVRTRK